MRTKTCTTCKTGSITIVFCFWIFSAAAASAQTLGSKAPSGSTPPPTPTQAPNPLSVVQAAAAAGGREDTSYTATTLAAAAKKANIVWIDFDKKFNGLHLASLDDNAVALRQRLLAVKNALPPDDLLTTEFQVRSFRGHTGPIYSPSLIITDNRRSLEFALQHFDGSASGFGLTARVDLASGRRKFVRSLYVAKDADITRTQFADLQAYIDKAARDFVSASRSLRIAGVLGYRSLSDVGNLFDGAISLSQQIRVRRNAPDRASAGFTPLLSIDGGQYNPSSPLSSGLLPHFGKTTSFVRFSTALIFQDRTLFLTRGQNDKVSTVMGRWKYQIGVEYNFWNAFDLANTASAFIHIRANEYVQFSVYGGLRSDKQDFVGANLAFSMYLDRRSR